MKPKVLVVEDKQREHDAFERKLRSKVELISVLTIAEANSKFRENPDLVAIVMDACVPGNRPNTEQLVIKFRETFGNPIIAISTIKSYRQILVEAGCSHQCTKDDLPETLLQILGL